jgi:phosphate acetyltransferase
MTETHIENRTFDEIAIGDSACLERALTMHDIKLFAAMSGDVNPAHVDEDYARSSRFQEVVAHGMWGGALVATLIGTQLPGPGTIYLGQTLRFRKPVRLGDRITVSVTVSARDEQRTRLTLVCEARNQAGEQVITGEAEVIAPTEKVRRPRWIAPDVQLSERLHLLGLLERARRAGAITVAVVHPVDRITMAGVKASVNAGLIVPVLVGPQARIRAAAAEVGFDLDGIEMVATEHSHAAAMAAVRLARDGRVDAVQKGSLHTDELMQAALDHDHGLRTARRMSHVFAFDVPTYARPLFITDAAINIAPTLEHKRDIVQNAIDFAIALGIALPKVAILSAVETVTPAIRSTLDGAALCKMAERGQITGGVLDGPLAFDNAVSPDAAAAKGIVSPVAGCADILVVPDIEAGNMLAKQLEYLGGAEGAGIVVGARVPIILTSRADDSISRMASCALAVLLRQAQRATADDRPASDAARA